MSKLIINKLKKQNKELIKTLNLAGEVMDYCAGDSWERECTKDMREKVFGIIRKYKNLKK